MFNKYYKRLTALFCLITILLMIGTISVLASDSREGYIVIGPEQTIKGPGVYGGEVIQIDGTIDGITFAAGREVRINGVINGDLIIAAQEVTINGKIQGNLYAVAQRISIQGQVMEDALGAAQTLVVHKDAIVSRDLLIAGQKIQFNGKVERQLLASGQSIIINGSIGDDTKIAAESLELQKEASIDGNLFYQSPNEALLSGTPKISGRTDWEKTVYQEVRPKNNTGSFFLHLLWSLTSSLLIWFLIALWRPAFWSDTKMYITEQPLKTLGLGALALIVTPILAIILMITLIGLPLGIILGLIYGVTLYLAKIIAAVFIGYWLAQKFSWPVIHKGVWLVLLGLAIIALLTKIPLIGFLLWLLVIFTGLGSVILSFAKPVNEHE
ncbi:MAG: hypothetical protein CVU87_12335 [Firmicutes bacterium HGW-Firmicutes-12]|nr:MAG: hypothetical protein CVU87_12335 [Firmicutes bacterium HGW-Firmicutes-12]